MTFEHDEQAEYEDSAPEEVAPAPRRLGCSSGCLLRVIGVLVAAVVLVVVIGEVFDQGKKADAPPQGFTLPGPAQEYVRGDVNYFEAEHVYVVRFPDGEFRAFYDRSSKRQELGGDCRIEYDETALPGRLDQVSGMRGAFVEECEGVRAVWRVDGLLATTSSYGDLNEFETRITGENELFVDTSERNCTRSVGVPGIAPYEERTCSGAP